MPIVSVMAESKRSDVANGGDSDGAAAAGPDLGDQPGIARDPGAPIGRDEIDPDLVKLARPRSKVGVITAAGLVFLCVVYLLRLVPDLRFARNGTEPTPVAVADVLAGTVELDELVSFSAEPLLAHAIRAASARGSLGHRLVPVRGTGHRLWIVVSGDGWDPPATTGYAGRLRKLDDLAFASAARAFATAHPRPVFATASAVRAGLATGTVTTVSGDRVSLTDGDAVALDTVDPDAATIAASFNERLPDAAAWSAALGRAGLKVAHTAAPDAALGQVRFTVDATVATATAQLEAAGLWAARVEPVTRHHETTWGVMRKSPPAGLDVGGTVLPDPELELVGLYVARGIPDDAYALVTGELPADYWYVTPITIALIVIALVFAWALVRAIRRDMIRVA
jgi:hypothetical protein